MAKDSKVRQEQQGVVLSFIPTGEYYFNKGINAYHRHDLKKAKKYLQRAMQLEPYEPMIACQLGLVCMQLDEFQQSNELFTQILDELDPSMTECHYFLANNYAELGLFHEAYKHANKYLELDPYGEFAEEAEDLIYVINTEETDLEDSLYMQDELIMKQEKARQLLESGNFQMAIKNLQELIEKYPDFWSAYNNLALGYFYLGEMEKAANVLKELLDKNPGNLHALCNLAVFLYHQHRDEELQELINGLEKIQPLLIEHQYKLGATFALLGKHQKAFYWLNKLKKQGFEGDASFYYWLSHVAYSTGHEQTSKSAWKQLLELSPEKEGTEPWNKNQQGDEGFENHVTSILNKLKSDDLEERLFGIFLISVSNRRQEIISHPYFKSLDEFTITEKIYLANVLDAGMKEQFDPDGIIGKGHGVATLLYEHHHPVYPQTTGLFHMWFSIFINGLKEGISFANQPAYAAAVDYVWNKIHHEKISQSEIAKQYHISPSTLQKYIKMIQQYSQ
ncbi:tetratricopeptide repeat protein [Bacillus sp. APMAM]|nr:tetratricopeptide repeat protein [Bacillus sp. APMAM]RTZ55377.1 tetratricopeptide repeat protein [Bacillus sp. SAJ1]